MWSVPGKGLFQLSYAEPGALCPAELDTQEKDSRFETLIEQVGRVVLVQISNSLASNIE